MKKQATLEVKTSITGKITQVMKRLSHSFWCPSYSKAFPITLQHCQSRYQWALYQQKISRLYLLSILHAKICVLLYKNNINCQNNGELFIQFACEFEYANKLLPDEGSQFLTGCDLENISFLDLKVNYIRK